MGGDWRDSGRGDRSPNSRDGLLGVSGMRHASSRRNTLPTGCEKKAGNRKHASASGEALHAGDLAKSHHSPPLQCRAMQGFLLARWRIPMTLFGHARDGRLGVPPAKREHGHGAQRCQID